MKRNNLTEKQKQQAERVFEKVEQLIGVQKERITSLSRLRELVYIRTAIVNAFLKQGWKHGDIAATLGKDRTTIIHLRKKFNNMLFVSNHSDEANEYIQLSKRLSDFEPLPRLDRAGIDNKNRNQWKLNTTLNR